MKKKFLRVILFIVVGLIILCFALAGIFALSNTNLPTHSLVTDRLSALEKARLAEASHLRKSLGDKVWPGWGAINIPTIVYNEEYAFIVDYPSPPAGWFKMPQKEARGGPWEAVLGDNFNGQVYYRQRLSNPESTPENFTVLVGERWVATMQTKEYMEITFYAGFRGQLPPLLKSIFPYRFFWKLLMGDSDTYIGALEHEAFHVLQGTMVPSRLAEAEIANWNNNNYPWDKPNFRNAWRRELDLLVRAVRAQSVEETTNLVRQFLAQRDKRRADAGLTEVLVNYERQREWLEGLAKYAELSLPRLVAATLEYIPLPALQADPSFKKYKTRERFWLGQIAEVRRTAGREGETRFYYGGMAQAVLLDRLAPDWKKSVFNQGVMLEDLLRQAIGR